MKLTVLTIPEFFNGFELPDDIDEADDIMYRIIMVLHETWEEIRLKKAIRNRDRER
jgi:hypothetical protein